jgi:N-acetylmuramoyl-L-alanine amidase
MGERMSSRPITEINIHCAATRPSWYADKTGAEKVAEINRWHRDLGWRMIGYHYVIDRDGKFYRGRPEAMAGAFEPKVNAHGIGVCLVGGYGSNATDAFENHYTPEQDHTLRKLIKALKDKHPTISKVSGHNDYSSKACPGFKVGRWLDGAAQARTFAESGTAQGAGVATAASGGLAVVEVARIVAEAKPEIQAAATEIQAAKVEVQAAPVDPLRWVLLAVIVIGAGYALYRRWADWQAGRQ